MKAARHSLLGIAAMVASQLAFLLNDTFIKLLSTTLPMGEIIFLRGLICFLLVGMVMAATGAYRQMALLAHRSIGWRMVGELGGTFFFILALFHMPIANATIIFQAVPLTATAGAFIFLAEPVGWRRWLAILVGFGGVVLVVRPGLAGFDPYGLIVLISVVFVAFRDICTRTMPKNIPTLLVVGVTAFGVTVMGAVMGATEHWLWPQPMQWLRLAGAALMLAVGYFTVIAAMRLGEMAVTAPFRYVSVVFAIIVGMIVWGDRPDALTLVGSGIIVAAGLYTLYRERRRGASPATVSAAAPGQG